MADDHPHHRNRTNPVPYVEIPGLSDIKMVEVGFYVETLEVFVLVLSIAADR